MPFEVTGGLLKIVGGEGGGAVDARLDAGNCPVCPADGLHTVSFSVRGHDGGSRFWELHVRDDGDFDLAAWRGMASSLEAGTDGLWVPSGDFTGGSEFDEVKALINTQDVDVSGVPANSTRFLLNGVVMATVAHSVGVGDAVSYVEIQRSDNDTSGDADAVVEIDDLVVSKCQGQCNDPFADAEGSAGIGFGLGDGDSDQKDFAVFQLCISGSGNPFPLVPDYCACFDRGVDAPAGDGDIDGFDFDAFAACASGADVPAVCP
jgi:hypothetical protein